ncbi:hypothetical protein CCACVL1_15765, partial [Corchorus capsularis]
AEILLQEVEILLQAEILLEDEEIEILLEEAEALSLSAVPEVEILRRHSLTLQL